MQQCIPSDIEQLDIRARRVIQRSEALVRESSSLLNSFKKRLRANAYLAAQCRVRFQRSDRQAMITWSLHAAMQITGATMGNLQLFDPHSGTLRIAAHYGFNQDFLNFFNCVSDGEAACGLALQRRARVLIEDVTGHNFLVGTTALEVLLDAGVRSVQSTPLITLSGDVLGILSTHWSFPHVPSDRTLSQLDVLTRTIANFLMSLDCAGPVGASDNRCYAAFPS